MGGSVTGQKNFVVAGREGKGRAGLWKLTTTWRGGGRHTHPLCTEKQEWSGRTMTIVCALTPKVVALRSLLSIIVHLSWWPGGVF